MPPCLFLITSDFPPRFGGVASYYGVLWQHCSDVMVATNIIGPSTPRVIRTSWTWSVWPRWLPLMWLVPFWKIKFKPYFLAAGEILPIGLVLFFIRLTFGWPYIVFLHGLDIRLAGRNFWKRFLSRQILKWAQYVIVNSQFTAKLAIAAGAQSSKIKVIYPSIETKPVAAEMILKLKESYGLDDKIVLLTVGRLVKRKGHAKVLQALSKIENNFNNLIYVIVGDGPERENLKKASLSLKTKVIFRGEISDEEKLAWYRVSDIFVLIPQEDQMDVEGFGIVYLEAQAAGLPIIAAPVGGVPEAVGEAGWFVSSVEELSDSLSKLLSSAALRNELGKHGLQRVSQFTPARQLLALKDMCL